LELAFELSIILLGIFAGLLIGSVGIGGVVVVPALIVVFGIPATSALAATMLAFMMSGIIGARAYSSKQSLEWNSAAWLWIGAAPAAFAARLMTHRIAAWIIEAAIALLALVAGVNALRQTRRAAAGSASSMTPRSALIGSGFVTGGLSTLTGTSGPLVLIPLLLRLEVPILTSLGLAQAIQLPIAAMATTGHWLAGTAEPRLGIVLGIGLGIGTWGGAQIAHRIAHHALRLIVSILLIPVGLVLVVKLLLQTSSP
jgi:uncharacterized membrane protein YfcA